MQAYEYETYPSKTRTGNAKLSRTVLSGWGAVTATVPALVEFTDRGRLWWRYTQSTALLELFCRPTFLSGDLVASGTVTASKVTLAEGNSSGITGTVDVITASEDSTGDIIVSFAHENDIDDVFRNAANVLDDSGQWNGRGTRFEALLSKVQADELLPALRQKMSSRLTRTSGVADINDIADPRQIASIHAKLVAAWLYDRRGSADSDGVAGAMGKKTRMDAYNLLGATDIGIDYGQDADVDAESADGSVKVSLA